MKQLLLLFLFVFIAIQINAQQTDIENICKQNKNAAMHQQDILKNNQNNISSLTGDTIHVAHYDISIDTINYSGQSIKAQTAVQVVAKMNNVNNISLSLLQLLVDSITQGSQILSYSYDDTTLRITPVSVLNQNDTVLITVYYHGQPKQDATGWGGFYFSGNYAFNLGVGFAADPHCFGRVWFPCIDEFTDRATYNFHITTAATSKAFCNGALVSQINNPNGTITWNWTLMETIPTYLACMAVAPYYTLQQNIAGIPVEMAVLPVDTVNTLSTFQHLNTILSAYINAWGPYPFEKVGYSVVPFNSGAMEHASQITIGKAFINGSLSYETLWAHELSHMWWGDKVTCETAGDMWLNEGWASYNEAFTTQAVYGDVAYRDWIRSNHRHVLQFAHIEDGSYLSFINVPHAYTYGTTVYKKGADIVHTLRNYMGDTAFFNGCKYQQNVRAYNSSNSYQFRDNLTASSGIDMTRFFDDWIFTEGFPHFSIDSVTWLPGGLDHYFIHCRQRSKGNSHLYQMPIEINLTDGVNDTTVTFVMDSATQTFHVGLPYTVQWISIDRSNKISDAISDFESPVTATGTLNFPETNITFNVMNVGTGTTVRVEHNFVAPDEWKQSNPGIRLSNYHYWKFDGLWDNTFLSKATFIYNGSNSLTEGYLDNTLITGVEDSLLILWRAGTWDDWHIVPGFTISYAGSHTNKWGTITVDTLKRGEYTFGYLDYTAGIKNYQPQEQMMLQINPNPASHNVHFDFDLKNNPQALLQLFDLKGNMIKEFTVYAHQTFVDWDTSEIASGNYIAKLCVNDKISISKKLVLMK
ncbi:MAG: M1 family aminopeptidase [Bacteroidia bacterium]